MHNKKGAELGDGIALLIVIPIIIILLVLFIIGASFRGFFDGVEGGIKIHEEEATGLAGTLLYPEQQDTMQRIRIKVYTDKKTLEQAQEEAEQERKALEQQREQEWIQKNPGQSTFYYKKEGPLLP